MSQSADSTHRKSTRSGRRIPGHSQTIVFRSAPFRSEEFFWFHFVLPSLLSHKTGVCSSFLLVYLPILEGIPFCPGRFLFVFPCFTSPHFIYSARSGEHLLYGYFYVTHTRHALLSCRRRRARGSFEWFGFVGTRRWYHYLRAGHNLPRSVSERYCYSF